MLPTRAISEALGYKVEWLSSNQTVTISTNNNLPVAPKGWEVRIQEYYKRTSPDYLYNPDLAYEGAYDSSYIGVSSSSETKQNDNQLPKANNTDIPEWKIEYTHTVNQNTDSNKIKYIYNSYWDKYFAYTYKNPIQPSQAPIVGSVLANIEKDSSLRAAYSYDFKDYFHESYAYGGASVGGCNWYADGRFWEVYGIPIPLFEKFHLEKSYLDTAEKYDELTVIRDIRDIRDIRVHSMVVYSETYSNETGHVAFIEYVERDASGNPINIYISDANVGSSANGKFDYGVDGQVRKLSISNFLNDVKPIVGYIVPNENYYK